MSGDEQIEELVKYLCPLNMTCEECHLYKSRCHAKRYARRAIEKGYRKASDVVRDIFNDLNEMWHKGRGFINYSDLVRLERLHEQKYKEEGNDNT